ncbi:probable cytochrome P450 6a23 [Tribolium madens]|uniref:probable cytochrome P450 6a23 n=1 Tax=Tribolium madens TaxID=41895 RepID=UPI001CF76117|nr:probable cytochrome P450 6a23 [Tribolium madens]
MFSNWGLLTDLVGVIIAAFAIIIAYYKWTFGYWKQKNIPYFPPSIPFGNLENLFTATSNIGVQVKHFYDEMRHNKWKHGGLFFLANPTYVVVDLEYVKNVLTKDFQYFVDRGVYYNEEVDPIGAHLFALGGPKWRNLRTKLTPTFTSGKMKMMFQTLVDCEVNLVKKIEAKRKTPIDIKDVLGCFTADIIGSCAFGLNCNTFEEEDSPFRKYGKKVFAGSTLQRLQVSIFMNFPRLAKFLQMRQIPKDIGDFYSKVVTDNVEYREKNNFTRKDFMQLLIDMKNNKSEGDGNSLTLDEITAQCFVFFIAGFETSSTTMTFALYELSKNQELQEKVRTEIETVLAKYDGKITYEAIQDMKYMNQVLNETLRKYPPLPFITRQCVKDYKIPDQDIIIENGTRVIIPILGIHYDPEYYPNPDKFDPERFSEENVKNRHNYAHIPFGEGPRICIGLRFGLMQSKVGLTSLLRKYRFKLNKKTKEPIKFQVKSATLAAEGEVWLDAEKL